MELHSLGEDMSYVVCTVVLQVAVQHPQQKPARAAPRARFEDAATSSRRNR